MVAKWCLCKPCKLSLVNHAQTAKCKSNNGLSFKMKENWYPSQTGYLPQMICSRTKNLEACYTAVDGNLPTNHGPVCCLNTRYDLSTGKSKCIRLLQCQESPESAPKAFFTTMQNKRDNIQRATSSLLHG